MEQNSIVLCDTNIIIELYKNNKSVISELKKIGRNNIAISVITAGELIYGAINKQELILIQRDIESLIRFDINKSICDIYYKMMLKYSLSHNLSVPDGLIAATAIYNNIEIFTLNKKDFRYINDLHLY
jgi:predicted nucleic acid-binding protein